MTVASGERERQRFEHLVLGRPRPRLAVEPIVPSKRKGRRIRSAAAPAAVAPIVVLAPGIEERVALRERWSHKAKGTPETHEHADLQRRRPGSLARLYASGTIDADQLAAAEEIAEAHRAITADVAVRTASLETRVDGGGRDYGVEIFARVRGELAYDAWRRAVVGPVDAILDMIVGDIGVTIVAQHYGMSARRAGRLLVAALDLWWVGRRSVRIAPAGA